MTLKPGDRVRLLPGLHKPFLFRGDLINPTEGRVDAVSRDTAVVRWDEAPFERARRNVPVRELEPA